MSVRGWIGKRLGLETRQEHPRRLRGLGCRFPGRGGGFGLGRRSRYGGGGDSGLGMGARVRCGPPFAPLPTPDTRVLPRYSGHLQPAATTPARVCNFSCQKCAVFGCH